ncbi:tRNA (adenosine(37)-N6)-threonylcarbamoyltransferase complex dimerization subunit type 1 TsaB [Halodurantibacterium flavum]|uniref:tRNA (Adenosine(37)-N6)-threonylcarbamoyltransferase complex dimerization subunit type 1 TsaB n=1 Tax=Halodurantibacterium flavum TaxID=1382802 RepID=A0ABW4SAQ8_9RHOB
MREPLILGFDTSAAHCAAALLMGPRVIAQRHEPMDKGQAERLVPLLEDMLSEAGHRWPDLTAIGVGIGPGNFTGIRIAVAAARGLALALRIPAIGITSFEALAHGLPRPLLVTLDARRGAHYAQDIGAGAPFLVQDGTLPHPLPGRNCVGDDAGTFAVATGGRALNPAFPLAEAIAREALMRLGQDNPRPAPLYLRAADAAPSSDVPPRILP